MSKKYPKVLVACPTTDKLAKNLKSFLEAAQNLDYPKYELLMINFSDNKKYVKVLKDKGVTVQNIKQGKNVLSTLVNARNIAIDYATKNDFDALLLVEQGIVLKKDIIQRLLLHKKGAVSGLYLSLHKKTKGGFESLPPFIRFLTKTEIADMVKNIEKYENDEHLYAKLGSKNPVVAKQMTKDECKSNKLIPIMAGGIGCMMLRKEVFTQIKFRDVNDPSLSFCQDLLKKRIGIYLDLSANCPNNVIVHKN